MAAVKFTPAPECFQRITELTTSGEVDLNEILGDPNFIDAFTKQHSSLAKCLLINIAEVARIAMGRKACTSANGKKLCRQILITQSALFTPKVAALQPFSSILKDCSLTVKSMKRDDLVAYCMILHFYVKLTNGDFLMRFDASIFERLLDVMDEFCVRDLLVFLVADGHPQFSIFLDRNRISEMLWRRYSITKDLFVLKLLTHVMSSLDPTSGSMKVMAKREKMKQVIDMALQTDDMDLSDEAMEMLFEMCSHCDEEDDSEDSLFVVLFGQVVERVDEVAGFVSSDTPFSLGKTKAIELLAGVISSTEKVAESIVEATVVLFKRMMESPRFSILHCGFMKLFALVCEAGADINELDEKMKLRETIAYELTHRSNEKLFYGHLFRMADIICEGEDLTETTQNWQDFVGSTFTDLKRMAESDYGGTRPVKGAGKVCGSDDDEIVKEK